MGQADDAPPHDGRPSELESLLGTVGLALSRLAEPGDAAARQARVAEMRRLLNGDAGDAGSAAAAPDYDIRAGYALWAETYDRSTRLYQVEQPPMVGLIDDLPAGASVLDVGCGTGRYCALLAARGHRVVGVDQSPSMLAKARAKLPDIEFLEGDIEALPVADGAFDAAVCALALAHLPGLDGAARELSRALRPGGRLLVSDVHPLPILLGWRARVHGADGRTGYMRLHPHLPSAYVDAFRAAGFTVRRCLEPLHTDASALTLAAETLPEANRAAWVGLPAVILWEMEKVA